MIAFNWRTTDESKGRQVPAQYWDQALHRPVNEFLLRQGKRIRADLVDFAYTVSCGRGRAPAPIQEFIELLHAGSLIVDDVQDDASTRRDRPTLHRIFGTPLAINTGNWMYFAAFEKLVDLPVKPACHSAIMKRSLSTVRGCHEGQALDLATNAKTVPQEDVPAISRAISKLKTGGLVSLAAWLGAAVANAPAELRRTLGRFGGRLGMALQMQNDLAELRKCAMQRVPSTDLANSRVTWPWAWAAEVCSNSDFARLQQIGEMAPLSTSLLDTVETVGIEIVQSELRLAFADLRRHLGGRDASGESIRILERLEQYHV